MIIMKRSDTVNVIIFGHEWKMFCKLEIYFINKKHSYNFIIRYNINSERLTANKVGKKSIKFSLKINGSVNFLNSILKISSH